MQNTNHTHAALPNTLTAQDAELAARLTLEQFPRSAAYHPRWVLENLMGPNVLWLTEALIQTMALKPGMRVLDLGCGKGISSIFLAQEFGVQVWATDLWIGATENWQRIVQSSMDTHVFPIHAEAHTLPFAESFFDAVISLDAYHYFGTDDLYLSYCSKFVKEGGQIGIVVPGLRHEFTDGLPEHLRPYWQADFYSWHSPDWWRSHWQKSEQVTVQHADFLADGWQQWLLWQEVCCEYDYVPEPFWDAVTQEVQMLQADAGRCLGFSRIIAHRN